MADIIKLLFDVKLMRPACVLLQAVAGGDGSFLNQHFSSERWLVSPTDGMKLMSETREQWMKVIAKIENEAKPR